MSVRERLEDAILLWNHGRKSGAWIQVLIAAAATSRARFPGMSDKARFMAFVREVTPTIVYGEGQTVVGGMHLLIGRATGDPVSLAEVIYTHLRCSLIHEAIMPSEVELCQSRIVDGQLIAELRVETAEAPLAIPDFWVINLAKAVAGAPENVADCRGLF